MGLFVSLVPPYWTPRGDRIYKITKDCSTKTQCQENIRNAVNTCKRDWYLDWRCVECCSGDLCNFYVTVSGFNMTYYYVIADNNIYILSIISIGALNFFAKLATRVEVLENSQMQVLT